MKKLIYFCSSLVFVSTAFAAQASKVSHTADQTSKASHVADQTSQASQDLKCDPGYGPFNVRNAVVGGLLNTCFGKDISSPDVCLWVKGLNTRRLYVPYKTTIKICVNKSDKNGYVWVNYYDAAKAPKRVMVKDLLGYSRLYCHGKTIDDYKCTPDNG